MNHHDIQIVQKTFRQAEGDAPLFADLLYARLFQLDPTLRRLFNNDLRTHKDQFMQLLGLVIHDLDQPAIWLLTVATHRQHHARYGITPQDYGTLGAALLWSMEQELGQEFTAEVRAAWLTFYLLLAVTMLQNQERIELENITPKENPSRFLPTSARSK